MIIISRKTGELLHADPLTAQQREDMAFAVFHEMSTFSDIKIDAYHRF